MGDNGSPALGQEESYRIGEVATLTRIEPHVLRYWESEFPVLRPTKTPRGQRLYRRSDIETVLTIKRLLYEQGFTIAGARRQFAAGDAAQLPAPPAPTPAPAPKADRQALEQQLLSIRRELARLLTLLSRR